MIDIIIFSKDRACQLDALLRSIDIKFKIAHNTKVIYTYSNEKFRAGYDILQSDKNQIEYYPEVSFKKDFLSLLQQCNNKLVSFMVDDILMTEDFDEEFVVNEFLNDTTVLCLSLRLGKNLNYCYALSKPMTLPTIVNRRWNWRSCGMDWGWAMSIDGNIFRKSDFIPYIQTISFSYPCDLEGYMMQKPMGNQYMMCFDKSKLINIPINRVVKHQNRIMNSPLTADKLNDLYLNGHRININSVFGINNNSCHYEVPLEI